MSETNAVLLLVLGCSLFGLWVYCMLKLAWRYASRAGGAARAALQPRELSIRLGAASRETHPISVGDVVLQRGTNSEVRGARTLEAFVTFALAVVAALLTFQLAPVGAAVVVGGVVWGFHRGAPQPVSSGGTTVGQRPLGPTAP